MPRGVQSENVKVKRKVLTLLKRLEYLKLKTANIEPECCRRQLAEISALRFAITIIGEKYPAIAVPKFEEIRTPANA